VIAGAAVGGVEQNAEPAQTGAPAATFNDGPWCPAAIRSWQSAGTAARTCGHNSGSAAGSA